MFKSIIQQKLNIFLYWNNFWDKKFNFKKYFFFFIILKKYLNIFLFELVIYFIFKKFIKKYLNFFYFGFFWFYNYQKWIIININYFNLYNKFNKKIFLIKKYFFFFKLNKFKLHK